MVSGQKESNFCDVIIPNSRKIDEQFGVEFGNLFWRFICHVTIYIHFFSLVSIWVGVIGDWVITKWIKFTLIQSAIESDLRKRVSTTPRT